MESESKSTLENEIENAIETESENETENDIETEMETETENEIETEMETETDRGVPVAPQPSWQGDLIRGFLWALLIVVSILFYTGTASHFIYVDF